MEELITKIEEYIYHTNDLTRKMDSYLKHPHKNLHTYIYEDSFYRDNTTLWSIRYPGATRGHIEVNENNEIIDIVLYDDECHTDKIYNYEVRECFKKYLGMKFAIIN